MKVKPAPGLRVRDPVTKQFLPDEGIEVDDNDLYYIRRLADGDVVPAGSPSPDAAPATQNKKGSAE